MNPKKISFSSKYKNSDKIKLKSTVDDDDIFSVSVNIDYIKPFANAAIGDNVTVRADKVKNISLSTDVDTKPNGFACNLKIFTEIRKHGA